jgi:uncharacterized protein YdiU (UPF0061 family)
MPTPFSSPKLELIGVDRNLLGELNLKHLLGRSEADTDSDAALLDYFSGKTIFPGFTPYAHAYGGHQFGNWAGQLGDGRAISVLEVLNVNGHAVELSIKGSGRTAFSRRGDGRAVMNSLFREYLGAAALYGLGIPSVSSLLLLAPSTDTAHLLDGIYRDEWYEGRGVKTRPGMLTRCAPSFLRFGSLQLAAKRQGPEGLYKVARFALGVYQEIFERDDPASRDFLAQLPPQTYDDLHRNGKLGLCYFTKPRTPPACIAQATGKLGAADLSPEILLCLLTIITKRAASLVAAWQSIGFAHGVMNTDNISLFGLTIDLNVYAFLTALDDNYVPVTALSSFLPSFQYSHERNTILHPSTPPS